MLWNSIARYKQAMADTSKPQDDLSIEEIRDSIRRILADDDAEGDNDTDDQQPEEEPLELTHKINEDGSIVDMSSPADAESVLEPENDEPVIISFDQDAVEETLHVESPLVAASIIPEEPTPMNKEEDEAVSPDNLLSSTAAEATSAVMAKLARHTAITNDPQGGATIEAMVRELLKPMLREWLDANLPNMVQEIVEREIEKLTKRI